MPSARPRTPVIQETAVDIWTSAQSKPEPKKPGKAQRHVTFHLPESPQESGSDNVPIEAEAGAIAIARPGYARRDYYEHSTTRSNWSEADGNSDPETAKSTLAQKMNLLAAEITVQPTLEEASDNCTQECLILGHSDSCWMPAALPPCQQPRSAEPVVTRHSSPAPHLITTTAMCHNPPEPQPAAICTTPPRSLNQELGPGARAEARGAQGRVVAQDDSHQVRRCSPRALFCTAAHDDSIKVIPMTTFTPGQSSRGYPNIEDDPM
ncbi:protocadherin-11 X-linked-like [Vombatus ursinus]|uniref:protocadherin-11 X-linked-like n=1 Tax=Vombatus ursinus TaxID=29139 RepID=UPI000FFD56F0|nr:protocadherin-11 X-linked-like [Vombatus ursinus]